MEVAELKRLLELGRAPSSSSATNNGAHNFHNSLEEATELEYLRNILFEFMMGRQTAVRRTLLDHTHWNASDEISFQTLAKVVAAVVKFTPEQTRKIAEREEQRQSLVSFFVGNGLERKHNLGAEWDL